MNLNGGTTYKIIVGQAGSNYSNTPGGNSGGGGGGGTFLTTSTNTPLLVAGGGGGSLQNGVVASSSSANGQTTTSGANSSDATGSGGTNGSGGNGSSSGWGGGGGGLTGNGTNGANCNKSGGTSFTNGGLGGDTCASGSARGGFGGGGGTHGFTGGGGGGGGYSGGGGSSQGGTIQNGGGGGSFVAAGSTNIGTSNGTYNGSSSGITNLSGYNGTYQSTTLAHGYLTITSSSPAVSSFAPTTTLTNSSTLTYDLLFTQSVTDLAANDFSVSGTGSSSCSVGTPSGSGTTYQVQLTGCSPGTVILTLAQNAVTNSSSQSGPSTATSAATVTIDQTAPTISSVTAPSNGTYSPTGLPTGSALTFSLVMSESVIVTTSGGTPSLSLTIGSVTRSASYLSQSDSRTLTFRYTLTSSLDEIDSDGIALSSTLNLNDGVIADLATNALTNTSLTAAQALPSLTSVLVAQRASAPTITGIDAGNTQLSVNFTAGTNNGSAISNYKYSLNGGAFTAFSPVDTTSPLVITGLTNGTSYAVRILAVTAVGDGDSSTAVSATPTAIVVAAGSDITATFGQSATSLAFTASGGSSPYTFSLSPSISGISIDASTGVVSSSASLAAGNYTTFVIATDSASRSGQKAISVTISADTPTITIALTGAVTSTPLAASVAIIATVSQEGSVDFQLGGVSISGCSAVATSGGSASCSWTPAALGSAALIAILTPTDNTNYIAATSPSLAITVVTGTSAITLTLSTSTPTKGQTITITATTTDIAGVVAFRLNGTLIKGCKSKTVSSALATCSWKVSRHGEQTLSARFTPTNNAYNGSAAQVKVVGLRRSGR